MRFAFTLLFVIAAALLPAARSTAAISYTGVNLAGADFGEGSLPGTYGTHYIYPNNNEVEYFLDRGMNTFRLPFRWERLQRSLSAPFDATELNRLNAFVNYATSQGGHVVLDPHNYARYNGNVIGGGSVSNAQFADFWSRLATQYKDNPNVIFDLMNEPNSLPTEQWLSAANAAIGAIRTAGAQNLILVPGNAWTGAHSWSDNWYGTPNASVMLGVVDPANNYAYDVHQYLDSDSSGTSDTIVSPTIGAQRLAGFTQWLKTNNRRGFLGEFAAANATFGTAAGQIGDEAITNMLQHVADNDDVWLGWTWWAAGPWWQEYRFTLEPTNLNSGNPVDRPAMATLAPFFADGSTTPITGDYNLDGHVDGDDLALWRTQFGQTAPNLAADGDANGRVDGADFLLWQRYAVAATTSTQTAVPEPSTCILLAFALLSAASLRPPGPGLRPGVAHHAE
ncbi:cellulase family glycosylhydrolase [Lacipirellula sp.]|uniref:cellulase family glycosylhydrolase n=1 Tax=Lacipirellula sp. TaxID=2691419 RepID=UPI003D0CFEDE